MSPLPSGAAKPSAKRTGYHYSVYGLELACSAELPGLAPAGEEACPVVTVRFDGIPKLGIDESRLHHRSTLRDEDGEPLLRVERSSRPPGYRFRYSDGTEFWIDDKGDVIHSGWRAPLTLEDTLTYLLGPILGFVLRLLGVPCLHASVVEVDGRALGFMGPAGAGKSTLAAAFARRGFAVMSDDILALRMRDEVFLAQPGYPRLRLWPDAAVTLFGSKEALPHLTPNWDKRYLALDNESFRFERQPRPLGAVYVLGDTGDASLSASVEPMKAREAMMAVLRENAQGTLLDKAARAREFEQIGGLVTQVPVRRLVVDRARGFPADHADAILEDFRTNPAPAHV